MSQSTNPSQPPKAEASSALEGAVPPLATPEERNRALDEAFDYRGDVTIETDDGRTIQGYVFDRRGPGAPGTPGPPGAPGVTQPYVRIMPSDGSERVNVPYASIRRLVFSGRDTAAGKSWETWLKKWLEKKRQGQSANLMPEPLDES